MGFLANRKVLEAGTATVVFLAILGLIIYPSETTQAAKDGLLLCFNVIIPSLFPFFVLSVMVVELGIANYIGKAFDGVMRPLFNVNGACATPFVLGFIGGYPTGAKTAISLYEKGLCTKKEAERLLSFSNNSGPAFILGVVGAGIFSNSKIGVLLYSVHALSSVLVGLLFRFYGRDEASSPDRSPVRIEAVSVSAAFTKSIVSSFQSTLNICAFVVFFTVAIKMLFLFSIIPSLAGIMGSVFSGIGLNAIQFQRLLTGIIEISSGVWSLRSATTGARAQLAMAAFMLGWAGISVHCQVLSFIGQSGLSSKTYILGKFLHGIISALLVYLTSGLMGFDAPVSSYLVEQLEGISSKTFGGSLLISFSSSAAMLLVIFLPPILRGLAARKRHPY